MRNVTRQAWSRVGYDRLARLYHGIEWIVFRDQLQMARIALIESIPAWSEMLVLGDGDGRLMQALRDRFPQGHITSVDQSGQMIRLQQERLTAAGQNHNVHWIHTDALDWQPEPDSFDVIVSAFFLDCFTPEQLKPAFQRWTRGLRQDGTWMYCDFVETTEDHQGHADRPPAIERIRRKGLLWSMHFFFQLTTGLPNRHLVDVAPLFNEAGFVASLKNSSPTGLIQTVLYRRTPEQEPLRRPANQT